MPEIKYDWRSVQDWKEIAQELFDRLVSLKWKWAITGLRSAEVQHLLKEGLVYFRYSVSEGKQSQVICEAVVLPLTGSGAILTLGTVQIERRKADYHPKARRVETPLC